MVLPDSTEDLLLVRPLSGTDDETTGILTGIEEVESATFPWPDPSHSGDQRSARLLREALQLSSRSSAGPFRSFGSIAVEPRPYQLVPLLMALRLETVRLLIADDVGIGKTVEASLIAKEMLESGTVSRFAVLCPPHLAEQWQKELSEKFHIDAELVLSGTARRLERKWCAPNESLFEVLPYTIVSTDFIKADSRRDEFLRTAPELIIVDEAHACAADPDSRGNKHQRFELLSSLAADPNRNLVLVTATPHSGNEGAFRSLVGLLGERFADLPDDDHLTDGLRKSLARHLVQRRRNDIAHYLAEDTAFPARAELPEDAGQYRFTPEYADFVHKVIGWAKESASDASGKRHQQRVRFWAALALLRSISSSPAAAVAALASRAGSASTDDDADADDAGRSSVLDQDDDDETGRLDVTPGADPEESEATSSQRSRRKINELARQAGTLLGPQNDAKLAHTITLCEKLYDDGFNPIIFCRFIDTARYVAEHLSTHFAGRMEVAAVTGEIAAEERERRVADLGSKDRRILVATDCLSEGINLQAWFDAVLHYDLPWNPTRLEQREGRVDRFGQPSPEVRIGTIYGQDNRIDQAIRNVLLRKHRDIRNRLGVSISVPVKSANVMVSVWEAIFEESEQLELDFEGNAGVQDTIREVHAEWERVAASEERSRTRFAQHAIATEEVAAELAEVRAAIGSRTDVARFVRDAVTAAGGQVTVEKTGSGGPGLSLNMSSTPLALREAVGGQQLLGKDRTISVRFEASAQPKDVYLTRTHPVVEGLASHLLDSALDADGDGVAARCGGIRTRAVSTLTTILLVRYRFDVTIGSRNGKRSTLAEDTGVLAFSGPPNDAVWQDTETVESLLAAEVAENLPREQREGFLRAVIDQRPVIDAALDGFASERAAELQAAHNRVRKEAGASGSATVTAHRPVDVVGLYVLIPV